ncbi:hypothetical protein L1277_002712 [Okibacterium sp. HSC-33S16]|uniref:hypothetical protein n=1 Tax=Okibacterium sp. HSC-33S16 TaxID=2910965 RepID=UPI00209FB2D2|nr:hypothetical protein [Okibacterium sp. HSC-33S16]MCP2032602.1 hypothetical protein [Okibacterium sp. HSC-33S16]
MDTPAEAIESLGLFADRSKRKSSVNFPIEYVKRADGTKPMAARLFRSNDLRLKLHMTLVMRATKAPHTLPKYTTRYLARLLNVPGDTGPRRINDAMKWLREEKLIASTTLADGKEGILLLQPDGSGDPWEVKGATRWVGVPFSLWTKGWILQLGGRDLAVLLALLELNGGSNHPHGEMMSGHRKKQYGLADDTWTRATQELETQGLLETTKVVWGNEEHELRTRKRYRIVRPRLDDLPNWSLT